MNRSAEGDALRSSSSMIAKVRPSHGASIGSVTSVPAASSRSISAMGMSVTASHSITIDFIIVGESHPIRGSERFDPAACSKCERRSGGMRLVNASG
jgi:hypothetical protein